MRRFSYLGLALVFVVGLAGCWPDSDIDNTEVPTGPLTLKVDTKSVEQIASLMQSGALAAPPARPTKVKATTRWFDNANVRQSAQSEASIGELITVARPLDRSYIVNVADMDNRSLTGIVRMATRDGLPKAVIPQRAFLPMMEGLVVAEKVDGSFDFPTAPIQPVVGTGVDGKIFILEFEVEVPVATVTAGGNADTLVASATVSHALGDSIRRGSHCGIRDRHCDTPERFGIRIINMCWSRIELASQLMRKFGFGYSAHATTLA